MSPVTFLTALTLLSPAATPVEPPKAPAVAQVTITEGERIPKATIDSTVLEPIPAQVQAPRHKSEVSKLESQLDQQSTLISDLQAALAVAKAQKDSCTGCPANCVNCPCGCSGSKAVAKRWMTTKEHPGWECYAYVASDGYVRGIERWRRTAYPSGWPAVVPETVPAVQYQTVIPMGQPRIFGGIFRGGSMCGPGGCN